MERMRMTTTENENDGRQASCAERIEGHLNGRLEDFRRITRDACSEDSDKADEAQEEQYALPLEVSTLRVVKVLLSTGGPADWFEVTTDPDGEPSRIAYVFQDWFDGATTVLDGEQFDAAVDFLRPFYEMQ
jgi:hypothetical protein